jgi:HK97 family phage portal protein
MNIIKRLYRGVKGFQLGMMDAGTDDYVRTLAFLNSDVNSGPSRKTSAGPNVNPSNAMTLSTYFACIRNVAEDISKMGLYLYEGDRDNKNHLIASPIQKLLDAPNPEMTNMTFRETLQAWAQGWGNGVAEIEWSYGGDPLKIWPIHPSRLQVMRDPGDPQQRVIYKIFGGRTGIGETVILQPQDVLHVRGLGNPLIGYSVARLAAESVGMSLAAETFGASLFGNGAHPHGFLKHPGRLQKETYNRLKESFEERHSGATNANKPLILEEAMEWVQTAIPPNEAQFLETREFQVEEICRWFRMPPHKVQHLKRATFSNIESQALEYVTDTLLSWAVRWEQELNRKILKNQPGIFFEHNFNSLLRGDHAARSAYYVALRNIGAINSDEIRCAEGMNPMPLGEGGDKYIIQTSYTELKKVGALPPPATTTIGFGGKGASPVKDKSNEPNNTTV